MNLLGACMGNEGQSPKRQHCDTRQGNRDISRNPANPAHQVERFVHFEADGRITSNDPGFDTELNEVLNYETRVSSRGRLRDCQVTRKKA